jgi:hypothetical protein
MNSKKGKIFIIEYLRIYLFISVFTAGLYLAIKSYEKESVFLFIITVVAILSGAGLLLKLPEVMGERKSYSKQNKLLTAPFMSFVLPISFQKW